MASLLHSLPLAQQGQCRDGLTTPRGNLVFVNPGVNNDTKLKVADRSSMRVSNESPGYLRP